MVESNIFFNNGRGLGFRVVLMDVSTNEILKLIYSLADKSITNNIVADFKTVSTTNET